MVQVDALKKLAHFSWILPKQLESIAQTATEVNFNPKDFICKQHTEAEHIFYLLSGRIQFLLHFEGVDHLLVATSRTPGELLGWSAFRIPYRYTASVRCETSCRTICIPRKTIDDLCSQYPEFGFRYLEQVAESLANRLEQTRDFLFETHTAS